MQPGYRSQLPACCAAWGSRASQVSLLFLSLSRPAVPISRQKRTRLCFQDPDLIASCVQKKWKVTPWPSGTPTDVRLCGLAAYSISRFSMCALNLQASSANQSPEADQTLAPVSQADRSLVFVGEEWKVAAWPSGTAADVLSSLGAQGVSCSRQRLVLGALPLRRCAILSSSGVGEGTALQLAPGLESMDIMVKVRAWL